MRNIQYTVGVGNRRSEWIYVMYIIEFQNLTRSKDSRHLLVFDYKKRRITMNDNNLKYAKSERKSNKFKITKWKQILCRRIVKNIWLNVNSWGGKT